jgi:NADPH-dependent ferric siderophore reductase
MPQAPAIIGNLAESILGRPALVLGVQQPAPGFLEVELRAAPPPGGWHLGHEIQFRVSPTQGRRYSVRTVGGSEAETIGILVATQATGPGKAWVRRLCTGTETTALAGRHRPLREHGARRLYLGDGSALGVIDAYARSGDDPTVTIEVPAQAVAPLTERWPRYRFLSAVDTPGATLQGWLACAIAEGELGDVGGALLVGHAQSIQRQRRALVDGQILQRHSITAKSHWATRKEGL